MEVADASFIREEFVMELRCVIGDLMNMTCMVFPKVQLLLPQQAYQSRESIVAHAGVWIVKGDLSGQSSVPFETPKTFEERMSS